MKFTPPHKSRKDRKPRWVTRRSRRFTVNAMSKNRDLLNRRSYRIAAALLGLWMGSGLARASEENLCPKSGEIFLTAAEGTAETRVRENLIRKAIAACPDEARAYLLLGRHYQSLHLRSQAREAYLKALKRLPLTTDILRKIANLNPSNPKKGLFNLVGPLVSAGAGAPGSDSGKTSLRTGKMKIPKDPEARLILAQEMTRLGEERMRRNLKGGLRLLNRALEIAPAYERPRRKLIQNFFALGEYHAQGEWFDKAVLQYKKALRYAPDDPRIHLRIGEAYSRLKGREKEALKYFRRADALFNRRAASFAGKERASFRRRIKRGLEQFDENRPAYRRARGVEAREIGSAHLARADYLKAAKAFKEAIGWTPGDARLHYDLATALKQVNGTMREQNLKEAIQNFERAATLYRTQASADAAGLPKAFDRRTRLEIAYLRGKINTLDYLTQKGALTLGEKAIEFSIFVLAFIGFVVYLLRARLTSQAGS
jgi:tetratricopeptide (TPR) repeat protein